MAGSGADRTERATPKRRDEARRRGQVALRREVNTNTLTKLDETRFP